MINFTGETDAADEVLQGLKSRAQQHRIASFPSGRTISVESSLEQVAGEHGFESWESLSDHIVRGGAVAIGGPALHPWQNVEQALPPKRLRFIRFDRPHRPNACEELMRWARQMELISLHVAEPHRAEMVALIGTRRPYVLEQNRPRWKDDLFHLCDRGYKEFVGIVLTLDQVKALGLPAWNDIHGQHDGDDTFTLLNDSWSETSDAVLLRQMARLIASVAMEVERGYEGTEPITPAT